MLLVIVAALAYRLPRLDQRPMHTDEAVHAVKAGTLIETGKYVYDPHQYHGPTIYYFALPFIWFAGAQTLAQTNEVMFRLVPVVAGVIVVLLLLGLGDGLGWWAVLCAGLLTAFSPAMIFYSRYYIQEMVLVAATLGVIVSAWRYTREHKLYWVLLAGACLGLMHATKETCVLAVGAFGVAAVLTALWARRRDGAWPWAGWAMPAYPKAFFHTVVVVVAAVVVSAVFMSGLFSNPRGILDSYLAYTHYFGRAAASSHADGGALHEHPWHYYLKLLLYTKDGPGPWWSEALIVVLALTGAAFALSWKSGGAHPTRPASANVNLVRFIAFYTIVLTAGYSIIPYKTPWCMLGFLQGMIMLAGLGAVCLIRLGPNIPARIVIGILLALGLAHLGKQAYMTNYVYYADTRNPYVYAHTSSDTLDLAERIQDLAHVSPARKDMVVKVIAPGADYWPLPWYLREFPNVGYWHEPSADLKAPVVIVSTNIEPVVQDKLNASDNYQVEYYGLRPEVLVTTFIRKDLWDAFIRTRM